MAKQKLIKLSKAIRVFPHQVTRMRAHDLINTSIKYERYLTSKEQQKLQNVAGEIRDGKLFGENTDFLVMRKGKIIKIIPL